MLWIKEPPIVRDVDDVATCRWPRTEEDRHDDEGLPHDRRRHRRIRARRPTVVARAAWLAVRDDADLVIVCAFAQLPRRAEAMNVATLGGDPRIGQVLGRDAAGRALEYAMTTAREEGATVSAALLVDGEPSRALIATAEERSADLIVLGASMTARSRTGCWGRWPPR